MSVACYVRKQNKDFYFKFISKKEAYVYEQLKTIPNARVYYKHEIPDEYFFSNNIRIGPIVLIIDEGYSLVVKKNCFFLILCFFRFFFYCRVMKTRLIQFITEIMATTIILNQCKQYFSVIESVFFSPGV
jgi:hypothetical protein